MPVAVPVTGLAVEGDGVLVSGSSVAACPLSRPTLESEPLRPVPRPFALQAAACLGTRATACRPCT